MTPARLQIDEPHAFLQWLATVRHAGYASFDDVYVAQVFAIVAIAALARHDGRERLILHPAKESGAAQFAHAIGIEEVIEGGVGREPTERSRTVTLTRVVGGGSPDAIADKVVNLLLPTRPRSDAATLFWFVLNELLRNVGQHSQDSAGGIVAAQINDAGPYQGAPALQVVVADNGIGIFDALRQMRSAVSTPAEALI
ncbi:MAG: hypothetical protein ABIP94_14035, partial [Planctomycetota bacterium]